VELRAHAKLEISATAIENPEALSA
jgi:hypothetical protein